MTAEVVAMNKAAVALAADSAVTYGGSKIFTTAEKLFMLAPGHPVGIMIYNNAEFMGLPWSIIIDLYRKNVAIRPPFATLQEYTEDFLTFLSARSELLFPDDHQAAFFRMTISVFLNEIIVRFWQDVKQMRDENKPITHAEIDNLISQAINQSYEVWNAAPDKYSTEELDAFKTALIDKYASTIEEGRDFFFEKLPLNDEDRAKIQDLCLFLFTKNRLLPNYTGIAFAGYGENDLFPVCTVSIIENYICKKLKFRKDKDFKISFFEETARVVALAQDDMVNTLLVGIHPIYLKALKNSLAKHLNSTALREVLEEVREEVQDGYTNSTMNSIAGLPKGELAVIAETLVSVTSFMRKHSMDIESVGGAVDVAVISKEDGFVWLKRKHYFELEHNQHFK